MLVLTRTETQRIVIGDPNKPLGVIEVVHASWRVKLGFDGFKGITIHREEVAERVVAGEVEREKP